MLTEPARKTAQFMIPLVSDATTDLKYVVHSDATLQDLEIAFKNHIL